MRGRIVMSGNSWPMAGSQDYKKVELSRLRTELTVATDGRSRSEIQRKIAFVEAVIRMRDGTDQIVE